MEKRSFLGRLFGKREPPAKQGAKETKGGGAKGGGTATLPRSQGKTMGKTARREGGPERSATKGQGAGAASKGPVGSSGVKPPASETIKEAGAGGGGKTVPDREARKPSVPSKPIEPEILDPSAEAISTSREKIDVIAKKMTVQEEMTIKISDGIKGLSSILSNIDQRLEEQTQQSYEMVRTVKTIPEVLKDLPESSRAGVELLQAISQILENQSLATAELGHRIAGLPDLLQNLGERMEEENRERQEERSTFKESVETVKKAMEQLDKRHQDLSHEQETNTRKLIQSVRTIQSEYQNQVNRLVEKNRMTNRLILLMIFILAAGMVSIVAVLLQ